jgi:hypothetical protein
VLRGLAFGGAVLALVTGFLTPLEKYSWTGSSDLARVIDPDALLVATCSAVVRARRRRVPEWARATDLPAFLVGLFPGSGEEVARITRDYWDTSGIAASA